MSIFARYRCGAARATICPKKNQQNSRILHDICPKISSARKNRQNSRILHDTVFAGTYLFPRFFGGWKERRGNCPLPPSLTPVAYNVHTSNFYITPRPEVSHRCSSILHESIPYLRHNSSTNAVQKSPPETDVGFLWTVFGPCAPGKKISGAKSTCCVVSVSLSPDSTMPTSPRARDVRDKSATNP